MLKLTARIVNSDKSYPAVGVFVNDRQAGTLVLSVEQADELVRLVSAATELLHACKFLWRQAVMEGKACSGDPNKSEYDRAKAAIDITEVEGGAG